MPRWPSKETNAGEIVGTEERQVVLPTDGSIRDTLDELKVEAVHTDGVDTSYADALSFMEEKVTVIQAPELLGATLIASP